MIGRNRIRARLACVLIVAGLTGCNTSPKAEETKFLRRGESRLAKKDYAGALVEFLNASQAMTEDAEPYYQSGLAYLQAGSVRAGMDALREATRLNPKHAAAQVKLAELMTASQNKDLTQEAATRLQAVLLASPDNLEAIDRLALAEWQLGNAKQATRRLEETLQKFPAHLQSSVTLARLRLSRNDYAGAEDVLKKAASLAPQSSQAAIALGQLHLLMKKPERAEPEVRRALLLDNNNGPALLALASIQVAANRMTEAEQTYKRLSTLPDKAFKLMYARFLDHAGKPDAALAEFQKLVKDNPKDTVTLLRRSELYLRLGKTTEAQQDVQAVLLLAPNSADAHFAMAGIYKAQGLTKLERQELRDALRLNAGSLTTRVLLARNLTAANDAKSALAALDRAPEPQKATPVLIVERNWALLALGNTGDQRRVVNEALIRFGRLPDLVLQDAVLKNKERNYAGARSGAEEVLQHDPENLRAALVLAESYAAQHRDSEAVERLRGLAAAHPKSAELQDLLGKWYMTAGNIREARAAFESAHERDPKFGAADIALAELDRRESHLDAARQRLMRLLAANPRNVHALLLLADVEGQAQNRSAAVAKYRSVLELDSSNLYALNNLAYFLAFKDPDEGLVFAQRAVAIAPDDSNVQDTLGWVYYRRGMYSAATTCLKAALAKQPSASTQYHLAMSYLKAGNQEMGRKTLLAALKQDPNLPKMEPDW
jgi:tetratricopeptide (TPR) repeat protein